MRIVISDYSGHAFPAQLARGLARRGHEVLHLSSASFQTPKGRLAVEDADPPTYASKVLKNSAAFAKSNFFKRRGQEVEMGRLIGAEIERFAPDVVISGNAPLDTQRMVLRATRRAGGGFIFWVQDLYGEAIRRILPSKLGFLGVLIGEFYKKLEGRLLRASDHVVVIANDFVPFVTSLGGFSSDRVSVIENWAPLDEIAQEVRDNSWAQANLPDAPVRMVYSGTLGAKHNPDLLFQLASRLDVQVIVFSEGEAAEALREKARQQRVSNLEVRGWLPFEILPYALASADIMIVLLEPDAGIFSVPSKVLTYLCIGRPILGSMPKENLAARIIAGEGAGTVVPAGDLEGFVGAARDLVADRDLRERQGRAARNYAERTFDIEAIATKFETIVQRYSREAAND